MKKIKWTKKMVEDESKKYTSRFQFQKKCKFRRKTCAFNDDI